MTEIKTPKDHFILVPVDFSETSENAINFAVEMAKLFDNQITLLNVVSSGMMSLFIGDSQKEILKEGIQSRMNQYKAEVLKQWPQATVNLRVEEGKPYKTINQVADEGGCDQIVMGVNGANRMEQFIGSTTSRVISSSNVPVIAVKHETESLTFNNIVLPIDLTKGSKQKLVWAIHFAKKYNSHVHAIMEVNKDEFIKNKIDANKAYVERVFRENNIKHTVKLLDDRSYPDNLGMDTVKYADEVNADLIMIMTQEEARFADMFVGSYAKQIIRNTQGTPVMCINPKKTFDYGGLVL